MPILKTVLICFFSLVSSVWAAPARKPNVLLLCVDDLRPELRSFGVDYISSPNIDRLASSGRSFFHHYVQAPTCGASRYALLTGRYGPDSNDSLFELTGSKSEHPTSLPQHFRRNGYTTVCVGKVSHHPGGLGGPDWDDPSKIEMPGAWDRNLFPSGKWQHPRGAMHGLAHGETRRKSPKMAVFQSEEGADDIYPDGLITEVAIKQLDELSKDRPSGDQPFFLAVGFIRPHLPFGAPARYFEPYRNLKLPPIPHPSKPSGTSTWHRSDEFGRYSSWGKDPREDPDFADEVRKHYAACVSYADAQVGRVLKSLDEHGLTENTIIVLWGDHGWHLGEHGVWGKHTLYEESLRSPLVISYQGIPDAGVGTRAIVETVDLYPTLCDLAEVKPPSDIDGRSLRPQLENPATAGRPAFSYFKGNRTIRTRDYRLIEHGRGADLGKYELYDHRSTSGETLNIAEENREIVTKLAKLLQKRFETSGRR